MAQPRLVGDISDEASWTAVLEHVDTVIHCIARAHVLRDNSADPLAEFRAINRDATLTLAQAAVAGGVRRLIFLSSIGVNGNATRGIAFTATDAPHPHSDYAVAKWEAEQALTRLARETGLELVIIRPPLVIGPGAKGNLHMLSAAIARGLPLPFGMITHNRRDLVSIDTLADLVSLAVDHPDAAGGVFLVSDGEALSTREIVERLADLVGKRPRLLSVPAPALRATLRMLGRGNLASQLIGDLEIDIGATEVRLDWSPPRSKA